MSAPEYETASQLEELSRGLNEVAEPDYKRMFESLFEEAPIAYHEADIHGAIIRVNRAECELLGHSAREILGRRVWEFLVPEQQDAKREQFHQMIAGERLARPFELDMVHADGTLRSAVVHPKLIKDARGAVTGVISARLDVTAQKRAEQAQVEQNRLTELATDVTNSMIAFESLDASLQFCAEAVVLRLDAAFARIWIMNQAERVLELRASAGMYVHLDGSHGRVPVGKFKIGLIAEERRPHFTNSVVGDPRVADQEWAKREEMVGFAGYPLMVNDEVVGVVAIFSKRAITDQEYQALGTVALEIGVVIDRKTADEEIRRSEERYRSIVETAAEGIWNVTADGHTTFVNRQMSEMLGVEPEACLTRAATDYFFPEDREAMIERYHSLGKGNKETFDVHLRREDGTGLWATFCAAPLLGEDGCLLGILNMVTDITKRKQAEEALRSSLEFNQRIIESTGDGILLLDTASRFLYLSPAAQKLLEIDDGASQIGASWLDFWDGPDRQKLEAAFASAVTDGTGSFEGTCSTGKKTTRRLDVSFSAIRDPGGEAPRLVTVVRDITERKQLESQLSQAQKLESIGQLAAGVAHEINTPIQYIGDNARFLQDAFVQLKPMLELDRLSEENRQDAEYLFEEFPKASGQLLEGVEHVARIVRAMKEFSHPGPVEKTPTNLNQAIQSTIVVSRNEWKYVADLVEDFDPDLPTVLCVPGEINQVVLNLIVNAAHAITDVVGGSDTRGTITVSSRHDEGWAEIRVQDTGGGIPESVRTKVFDPFFTTKEVGKGTGQGLAIAHTVVVKNHGGTIQFETETGVGTTFIVRLPVAGT